MGIQVLGPLVVDGSGRLGPRDRVVLQALALRPGRSVTSDELADALWGDHPPASAHKNLQSCIVRLRKAVGTEAIETTADGYRLTMPVDEVDAQQFEAHVRRARELLEVGEADRGAFLLDHALELWRGDAFTELPDWPPARREAGRLEELRLDAEELLLDAQLRRGRARMVLPRAHDMVRAAPLRERRWELLALAQYRIGAQGEALRTIRQLRAVLARELGIDPTPEVVALEQAILGQDPSLLVPAPRPAADRCPWQGLMTYGVDDAERFFGREADVAACLAIVASTSFVALVGPSGSGKSSLLRAGVLAALGRRGHRVVLITPGPHPMQALSALPEDAPAETALAVDQTEELFVLCDDLEERRTFLERLTEEARRRPVLVTVRGDRLAQVTEHPRFSRLVERCLHLVGALDEAGLRETVERPAHQAGLVIEPGLVELLVREVRDDPGALPLLSHALLETWKRREGNTLTVDGYHASGGIHGAVAQSAEQLYARIEPDQRRLLRDLVLRLVSPGPDGEPVRIPVPRRLIASDADHDRLVESLVAARLVTSDEDVLEITHEALARAWPRLRGWLEDDREGQRIRHHLTGAADAWDSLGRPESELYRGVRLGRALDWAGSTDWSLTETEREFLVAGRTASEAQQQSAAERARVQARLISRLRLVLAGAVVLLVLALAGAGVAIVQSDRAGDNAAVARSSELRAVARRAAASALVVGDIDTSLLLAVAAARLDDSPDAHNSLLAAITRRPELYSSTPIEGDLPLEIDASADGRYVAVLDESRHLRLYHAGSGALIDERQMGDPLVQWRDEPGRLLAFSPDGRALAVAPTPGRSEPVALLEVPGLRQAQVLDGLAPRGWSATDLDFSGDGTRLAAGLVRTFRDDAAEDRGSALVWDLEQQGPPVRFHLATSNPAVALDQHGRMLYSAQPLTRHSVPDRSSRVLHHSDARDVFGFDVVDGGRRILAIDDGTPRLFDAVTGRQLAQYAYDAYFTALRVSPDGRRFAAIDYSDREVVEWRRGRTGSPARVLGLERGNPNAVAYSADGTFLLASARGGTALRRWDLTGERRYVQSVSTSSGAFGGFGVMEPGGGRSVVLQGDWILTDYRTGEVTTIPSLRGYRHTYGAFHPHGQHFVTANDRTIRVWSSGENPSTTQRTRMPGLITELDYTWDGRRLAVAELEGRLTMLDGETLRPLGTPVELGERVSWIVARPDGRTAVVLLGGVEPTDTFVPPSQGWALVDLASGRVVRRGPLQMPYAFWLAVSPDGGFAAVSGGDNGDGADKSGARGKVEVIDLSTGRPLGPAREWAGNPRSQLVYSADGSRLLASSPNGLVAVWDADSVVPTATLAVPEASALTAAFLANGRSARILDWDTGTAYDWDLSMQDAIEFACRAVGRGFTRDEWRQHFGDLAFQETCAQ